MRSDKNNIDRGYRPDVGSEFEMHCFTSCSFLANFIRPSWPWSGSLRLQHAPRDRFSMGRKSSRYNRSWCWMVQDIVWIHKRMSKHPTFPTPYFNSKKLTWKVGYREGIIAGKEAASQEGFDFGFANVGVPIGRELGLLRGISSVLLGFLKNAPTTPENERMLAEAQDISTRLSNVRFSDIMPRDLEAEEHAREHLEAEGMEPDTHEDIVAKRDVEGIEDMLANLSAGNGKTKNETVRPTAEDVRALKRRLGTLSDYLHLDIKWTWWSLIMWFWIASPTRYVGFCKNRDLKKPIFIYRIAYKNRLKTHKCTNSVGATKLFSEFQSTLLPRLWYGIISASMVTNPMICLANCSRLYSNPKTQIFPT